MQGKQYAFAVFMDTLRAKSPLSVTDIQGAFDSTTFAVILEGLENWDVGRTEIRFIMNMLKYGNIYLTYQGESVEAKVVKGCRQEVLSLLLWYMVVDGLLVKLNAMGYIAEAYADDLTIVIQDKYLSTVAR